VYRSLYMNFLRTLHQPLRPITWISSQPFSLAHSSMLCMSCRQSRIWSPPRYKISQVLLPGKSVTCVTMVALNLSSTVCTQICFSSDINSCIISLKLRSPFENLSAERISVVTLSGNFENNSFGHCAINVVLPLTNKYPYGTTEPIRTCPATSVKTASCTI